MHPGSGASSKAVQQLWDRDRWFKAFNKVFENEHDPKKDAIGPVNHSFLERNKLSR